MINVNLLSIKRAVMHEIIKKTDQSDSFSIQSFQLESLDDEVVSTVRERLNDAVGRGSRCFEMEIAKINAGSFFDYCRELDNKTDEEFINTTYDVAVLLANAQNSKRIPGGYLIFLECINNSIRQPVYIVIKAEQHEALNKNQTSGQITVLKRIFLSPSQKLYKIGILSKKQQASMDDVYPNNLFNSYLFDEQFDSNQALPATYFFDDFLGFSETKNSKIQTKRFYDKTKDFICENYPNYVDQEPLLRALDTNIQTDNSLIIDPTQFCESYFSDIDIKSRFSSQVLSIFATAFTKDITLLEGTFRQRKLSFPNKIKLSGPSSDFDSYVTVINTEEELQELTLLNTDYTVVVVSGKPNQNGRT